VFDFRVFDLDFLVFDLDFRLFEWDFLVVFVSLDPSDGIFSDL